jgi:lipid A 4'-phosphatase
MTQAIPFPRLWPLIIIPALVLLLTTWMFRATTADIDLVHTLSSAFGIKNWAEADVGIWSYVKNYGVLPAFMFAIIALGGITIGMTHQRFALWVRPSVYVLAVFIVGSGLITNFLLKDHWGRPRPKQVLELGGSEPFAKVLTPNFEKIGKSFPCGHATTGFVFFAASLVIRRSRPRLAAGFFTAALTGGIVIGLARILQGGHFPSDVVWAAGIMWFTSLGLLYAFKLQNFTEEPIVTVRAFSKRPKWLAPAIVTALLLIVAIGLVSIPRSRSAKISFLTDDFKNASSFDFDFDGTLQVIASDAAGFEMDFDGVGSPRSTTSIRLKPTSSGIRGTERMTGFLTEKNLTARLLLRAGSYHIKFSHAVREVQIGVPFQNVNRSNPGELAFDLY